MKKLFLALGIIVWILPGCSSTESLNGPFQKTSKEDYFISPNSLSEEEAKAMIAFFPKHKYHFRLKKRLLNTWAMFDTADLKHAVNDKNVDSIKFVLAAWTKDREKKPFPTVIMMVFIKENIPIALKPVDNSSWAFIQVANKEAEGFYNTIQYLSAAKGRYCPPPDGCTIKATE